MPELAKWVVDSDKVITFRERRPTNMKVRDSGMPEADYWNTLFDVPLILAQLEIDASVRDVVEFGCGYGTFAVPVAQRIQGVLYALDLEPEMLEATRQAAAAQGVENLTLRQRDFVAEGSGLPDESVDYAMLFNILHAEDPVGLLREAHRVLRGGGRLGVIHWRYDAATPRGPSLDIRPRPEDCATWIEQAGFRVTRRNLDLPPYHYGFLAVKK